MPLLRGLSGTSSAVVLTAVTVLLALLSGARPAAAAPGDTSESISAYDVRMDVHADGSVRVTETIRYDFAHEFRHGIFRRIPVRFRYDDTRDRVYPISGLQVTRDGEAEPVQHTSEQQDDVLRVGDPDLVVSGTHTYVIEYTVRGALNTFPDRAELYWNAVGTEWNIPIQRATARVTGPVTERTACYAGPMGSREPCAGRTVTDGAAVFRQDGIGDGTGLTVVAAFPRDAVPGAGPILTKRRTLGTMFLATPATVGGGLATGLLAVASALLAGWLFGRDRRDREGGRRGLPRRAATATQTEPPDGIRPGQAGALLDKRADVVHVTATIIDLAVRGYLKISETSDNWRLTKLKKADSTLLRYERSLFNALFGGRDEVWLTHLKYKFRASLDRVRDLLYDDLVKQRWYGRSPRRTRRRARLVAVAVLLAAVATTVVLGLTVNAGLIGLGLVAGALALLVVAGRFPARTARGSELADRVRAFRSHLAESGPSGTEDDLETFSRYLPYAMAFRLVQRWTATFADLAAAPPAHSHRDGRRARRPGLYWYRGRSGWTMAAMAGSIDRFTSTTTSTVTATTPPSASGSSGSSGSSSGSSSGFSGGYSGGGGGGGGGGSW
ncbi:DUF2207 domain-containing protein [Micromonospora sp. MS34]|uniref:DUF2207 domain-containing protein n=1 Tax=Micromonospora sp. MS34 TaxID=3385971 RepID=UPI0039A23661